MSHATFSTSAWANEPLTLEQILAAIERIPREPVAQMMHDQGCDPADGWVLVLPASARPHDETGIPDYVHFHALVDKPMAVNTKIAFGYDWRW